MTTTAAAADTDTGRIDELVDRLLAEHDTDDELAFRGAQYDLGLAWVWFPPGFGGLGLTPDLQRRVDERIRVAGVRADAMERNGFGIFLAAPTIAAHADDELKARLLRPLFTGEQLWCQLFSEPGAGSDLASLATRAVRDGDEWVVSGQKVWNTLAHRADRGMLVTRTDPDAPKHRGLTYFALDMHPPAAADHRRGRVQRGVPDRRARPRRRPHRRARRRVARLAHHADERTREHRRRRRGQELRSDR